jgi:hypothetical protein
MRPFLLAFAALASTSAPAIAYAPNETPATAALTNTDIEGMVERRVPPETIIERIKASPGAYVFGGAPEQRLRNTILLTIDVNYHNAIDPILANMYAKMNYSPDMAARERALPLRTASLDPLLGRPSQGVETAQGSIYELQDRKHVFVWSSHVLARDKVIKALEKDSRFVPVYDARYADFLIHLDFRLDSRGEVHDPGSTSYCTWARCVDMSNGPVTTTNYVTRSAAMNVIYYVPKDAKAKDFTQRLVYTNQSYKENTRIFGQEIFKKKHPIDVILQDFFKRYDAMMADPKRADSGYVISNAANAVGVPTTAEPAGPKVPTLINAATAAPYKFTLDARANSFDNDAGKHINLVWLNKGDGFSLKSSTNDLWGVDTGDSGLSDADGLTKTRVASNKDDSGVPAGTRIGGVMSTGPYSGFTAPYGALVGRINGQYKLLGANFSGQAWDTGVLELFYWDHDGSNNRGNISFTFAATQAAQTASR